MYHCGQLSRSPEKLALSIEVRSDVGCVLLVEDVFGRFWISCSSESAAKAPARSFRAGDEMESWVKSGLDALTGEAGRDRADRATGRTRASHWHWRAGAQLRSNTCRATITRGHIAPKIHDPRNRFARNDTFVPVKRT